MIASLRIERANDLDVDDAVEVGLFGGRARPHSSPSAEVSAHMADIVDSNVRQLCNDGVRAAIYGALT